MRKEQYDKATEINKEIQKYGDLIATMAFSGCSATFTQRAG